MGAGKLEGSAVVVERDRLPGVSRVALGAVCAKLAGVGIIIGMACITVLRCALEDPVDMA